MSSDSFLEDLEDSLEARWQLERVIQLDSDAQPRGLAGLEAELRLADAATRPGLVRRCVEARAAARFWHEQRSLVPAPFPFDDPRGDLRTQIGALRTSLARHLAWAAYESFEHGSPTAAVMAALHEMISQIRDLDEQVWGPVADPWAHYSWPRPRPGGTPWAGGPVLEAGPEDVAVLLLLGSTAEWSAGQITVTAGEDLAEAWGYELAEPFGGAGAHVLAAPHLTAWHAERHRAGNETPR